MGHAIRIVIYPEKSIIFRKKLGNRSSRFCELSSLHLSRKRDRKTARGPDLQQTAAGRSSGRRSVRREPLLKTISDTGIRGPEPGHRHYGCTAAPRLEESKAAPSESGPQQNAPGRSRQSAENRRTWQPNPILPRYGIVV